MNRARVLRVVGLELLLYDGKKQFKAMSPKQLKLQGLCAGDIVEYELDDNAITYIATKILNRKNHIDRPLISNVDNGFIVVSELPKADFYVIDKILVSLGMENIIPYIIISKQDIVSEKFIEDISEQYENCVEEIIVLSSYTKEGLARFIDVTKDKVSVLIGQSAVGKSTLLNVLGIETIKTGSVALKVGKKSERGKNTTKTTQLYLTNYGAMIADTPGFKMLNLDSLEHDELLHYYVDMKCFGVKCKYADCSHMNNNEGCKIIEAVNSGKVNKDRYERFIKVKNIMKNRKKNYGK